MNGTKFGDRSDAGRAVGLWYADFAQTLDAEVRELLEQARSPA